MPTYYGDALNNYMVSANGDDIIYGLDGVDFLYGRGGNDQLYGGNGDDSLFGEDGTDLLDGGANNDQLDGGLGNDTLTGGTGDDTFVVNDGVDLITDLGLGNDVLSVGPGAVANVTVAAAWKATAATINDGVVAITTAGLAVDLGLARGSMGFAVSNTGAGTTLTGSVNADVLKGAAGADVLIGGGGADTLIGGLGDDTYGVDAIGDVITELQGEGNDTVRTSLASYALAANIENLTFTDSAAHVGTGNAMANVITGGGGIDTLDGGAGADTLIGGLGNDIYIVDAPGDVVTELAGEGIDTVQTANAGYTLGTNVENLVLTGVAALTGTGNGDANLLTGNSGSNTLYGLGGNDTLDGGAGADTLIGGLGNDTYIIDVAGDVITELAGEGVDTVQTGFASYTLSANLENLILTGTAALSGTGNGDANVLTGNAAANTLTGLAGDDTLDGGAGADTLIGGLGNDTYIIDVAGDVITELAGEGIDTVQTGFASHTLAANLENLILTGTATLSGTGNADDNGLTGNAAANTLTGLGGNDTLDGGAGTDTMVGGLGDDTYVVDVATDVVTEAANEGIDTVQTALASYTLGANVENLVFSTSVAHSGTGNALNNTLNGNDGADTLNGGAGADTLIGGAGNDSHVVDNAGDVILEMAGLGTDLVTASLSWTLAANVENLTLAGTAAINGTGSADDNVLTGNGAINVLAGLDGNDTLTAGLGNDTLQGGNGSDRLIGGGGNDLLNGGAGADTFVFETAPSATSNLDTVQDFLSGTDKFSLSRAIFKGFASTGAMGVDAFWSGAGVTKAHDATDRIIYNTSTGALFYDSDGTGKAAAVQIATLTGMPSLAFSDFLIAV